MKKNIFFAVVALFIFASTAVVYANGSIRVVVDGEPVIFADQEPVLVDGRTLVPVRDVFEMLNFDVDWEPETSTAIFVSENHEMRITVGQSIFYTNGVAHELDVPAQLIGGRTMVPLRFPLESVGYYLDWDGETQTVIVSSTPIQEDDEIQTELDMHLSRIVPTGRPAILPNQGMPSASQISDWNNNFVPTEFETAVFDAINRVRAEHGRTTLPWSHSLAAGAALRTAYLAESDFSGFGGGVVHHYGSFTTQDIHRVIPTRGSWWAVTFNNRGAWAVNNVNITVDELAQGIIDSWMNSEVHRARLLSRYNYAVGVGTAINPHTGAVFVYAFFDASGR